MKYFAWDQINSGRIFFVLSITEFYLLDVRMCPLCEFVTASQKLYGEWAKLGSFIKKTNIERISPHSIWNTDETNRNLPISNTKQVASKIQHQPGKENEWSNSLMKHERLDPIKWEPIPTKVDVSECVAKHFL